MTKTGTGACELIADDVDADSWKHARDLETSLQNLYTGQDYMNAHLDMNEVSIPSQTQAPNSKYVPPPPQFSEYELKMILQSVA